MLLIGYLIRPTVIHSRRILSDPVYKKIGHKISFSRVCKINLQRSVISRHRINHQPIVWVVHVFSYEFPVVCNCNVGTTLNIDSYPFFSQDMGYLSSVKFRSHNGILKKENLNTIQPNGCQNILYQQHPL